MVSFAARTSAVFVAETFFTGELACSIGLVLFGLALFGVFEPILHAGDRHFVGWAFPLLRPENRHLGAFYSRPLTLGGREIAVPKLWAERLELLDMDRLVLFDAGSGAPIGFIDAMCNFAC